MEFYSVRDFRTESKAVWENLANGGEVVITNNGKPAALMIDIPEGKFDEVVQAVRQARAMAAKAAVREHRNPSPVQGLQPVAAVHLPARTAQTRKAPR